MANFFIKIKGGGGEPTYFSLYLVLLFYSLFTLNIQSILISSSWLGEYYRFLPTETTYLKETKIFLLEKKVIMCH